MAVKEDKVKLIVLNLIINGLPSIREFTLKTTAFTLCFKPYYKWITFNTVFLNYNTVFLYHVLNLIINGLPSIPNIGRFVNDIKS